MFGYVVANKEELSQEDLLRYRSYYCGLCRTLDKRFGPAGRITLTYDMTFLVLLLSSLYEPEDQKGTKRCIVHPVKQHSYCCNTFTDYAADMNIALTYHHCLDDWQDDKKLLGYSEAMLLKKKYRELEHLYPRQCNAMKECLSTLSRYEREGRQDLDAAANCFGALMGELFVCREDEWSDTLRRMGAALGRFIYMMDAYEDLPADLKKHRYNPLTSWYTLEDFEKQCRDILTLFIGECAMEFERLPLVQDMEILRNILYSGVWTRYMLIRQKKADGGKELENGK